MLSCGTDTLTRTAIVSDIHGNATALRAVVADLDAEGLDRVVCLGDVCQGGPEPDACVDLLAERGWPVVLGNADAFVLDAGSAEGSTEAVTERQLAVREWTFGRLTGAQRDLVAAYAPTIEHDLGDGRRLLGCHATPASFDPVVFPSAPEEEFRAAFGGTGADVVACGHIHLPYVRRVGDALVLNPGSVGLGYDHEQDPRRCDSTRGRRGRWSTTGAGDSRSTSAGHPSTRAPWSRRTSRAACRTARSTRGPGSSAEARRSSGYRGGGPP